MAVDQEKLEAGVRKLLEQNNAGYVEQIRFRIAADAHYLYYFEASTAVQVRRILWENGKGIYVAENADALLILREAIRRIPNTSAA